MGLAVEIKGFNELIRDVQAAPAGAKTLVKAALVNSTGRIQSEARNLAPHRTGTLQRSILAHVDYPEGQVTVNEKYGLFIEEGTGIYGARGSRITAKAGKVLAFKVGGSMVFAKSVSGIKPRPFFKPGVENSAEYIVEQFVKVIERLAHGLAGH